MNCRRAKIEIALSIGNDLDESSERRLERHLAECPHCRAHHGRVAASHIALQEPAAFEPRHDSLWPALVARLPARGLSGGVEHFNGWLPTVAVAVACLAMVALSTEPQEQVEYATPRPPIDLFQQPRTAPGSIPVWRPGPAGDQEMVRRALDPAVAPEQTPWALPPGNGTQARFPSRRR